MSLFPYVVDCMCGNNNQSLKQAFFKPCFSKCAQFTGRYRQRSEYHTDIKNFAGYSHEKYRKVVCITICFTFVQKHSEYTLIIGKVNS